MTAHIIYDPAWPIEVQFADVETANRAVDAIVTMYADRAVRAAWLRRREATQSAFWYGLDRVLGGIAHRIPTRPAAPGQRYIPGEIALLSLRIALMRGCVASLRRANAHRQNETCCIVMQLWFLMSAQLCVSIIRQAWPEIE